MTLRETGRVAFAAIQKEGILLVRYPINLLGRIVSAYILFLIIFLGGQIIGGAQFSDSLAGIVIGYFFVLLATASYQQIATTITRETDWGTLEQLYLSPTGFGTVIITSAVAKVLYIFLQISIILALMIATTSVTTDITFHVPVFTVFVVSGLGLVSVLGIGFAVGGITVLFKRVSNIFSIFQFVILGLVAAPVSNVIVLRALPLVKASALLQRAMRDGTHLWEFTLVDLTVLVTVAIVYFVAGYSVFIFGTRIARRRGVLGHY